MARSIIEVFFAVGLLAACGSSGPRAVLENPLEERAVLTDLDPRPEVVEVSIVATIARVEYLAGRSAEVWAYRDGAIAGSRATVPGPMLKARVGDEILARVRNELPVPTTVHWHGLRLPANADGSTSTQSPIMPGETYEYRFVTRDAGTFWFHPHVAADVQIERGLYAPFIVSDDISLDVAQDRTFILDDVKLTADGVLSEDTDALDIMLGRQGNVLLVNGQRDRAIEVQPGTRERWRFINAANGRYMNLELEGHAFVVIAWDGGLIAAPYTVERLLIAPGERYEVLVDLTSASAFLRTLHYDRGHNIPDPGPKELLEIVYGGDPVPVSALEAVPGRLRDVPLLAIDERTPARPFVLREVDDERGARFYINDELWPFNTPVMVAQGGVEIWEVINEAEMDHPFHVHGMFFEVLDVDGVARERIGWKDTVNVPQHARLRFAIRYDAPGMWMFHCHILEHAERGMMGDLMVHAAE